MTDTDDNAGWFAGDESALRARIVDGEADEPRDWPGLAVESGFADSRDDYYDRLHETSVAATREAVRERERAPTTSSSFTRCGAGDGRLRAYRQRTGRARRRVGREPL